MKNYDILFPLNHQEEVCYVRADGNVFTDAEGREYVDMDDMCMVLGQNNRAYIDVMTRALNGVTSGKQGFSKAKQRLQQYMMDTTDRQFSAIHFTTSGSEAAEWAVKLARKMTGRTEVLSFWNSIHGRTQLSASMSGLPRRKAGYGPLDPGVVFAPYPNAAAKPAGMSDREYVEQHMDVLKKKVLYESAHDIAAVIVEPVQGGGVVVPPEGFLKTLYEWAKSQGMMVILDEIQTGMGRTGAMYRYQSQGFVPDMLLLGKALGNGMHISALLVKQTPPVEALAALAGGVGDDLLCCTAACEVYRQLENGLLDHVKAMGDLIEKAFCGAKGRNGVVQVRCAGLAAAVEYETDALCAAAFGRLREGGFLPGRFGRSIYIKPPYTVTAEQIERFGALL